MRSMKARTAFAEQDETRAHRRASGQGSELFDADLFDLPQAMR